MSPQRRADLAYLAAILVGVLFVVLLGPLDRRLEILHINDFSGFWAGPHAVLAGVSPWDPAHYPQARIDFDTQRDDASVLNYMPWTVVALLPLGLLPLEVAAWTAGPPRRRSPARSRCRRSALHPMSTGR